MATQDSHRRMYLRYGTPFGPVPPSPVVQEWMDRVIDLDHPLNALQEDEVSRLFDPLRVKK